MKKILVPVDGSIASKNAAIKAVELAKLYGSEITFITVTQYPSISRYVDFDLELEKNYSSVINKINVEVSNRMDTLINELNISNIKYYKNIVTGEPYNEILNYANKGNFDLIVMGRKGYSKVQRFFLGSVTQRVLSGAQCPVLVVRE